MKDLISKCFVRDPDARPKAKDLLKHSIFEASVSFFHHNCGLTLLQELKNPSYEGLKDTLRTLHRSRRKLRVGVQNTNFAPPASPDTTKKGIYKSVAVNYFDKS